MSGIKKVVVYACTIGSYCNLGEVKGFSKIHWEDSEVVRLIVRFYSGVDVLRFELNLFRKFPGKISMIHSTFETIIGCTKIIKRWNGIRLNGWVFVYELSVVGSNPVAVTETSDITPVSSKEFLDIQATI